ncbi:MAG: hypothetical protein HY361_00265 [Candidatus Aenigmarchaeota archaeon]|nr:hypothetical protein [Candidatus Aenigmarchaeota archaeon]
MKMKKAQSAMEYLMTYGWAILIVIVVVAALYALGVFQVGGQGVTCSPCFSNFAYVDYSAGTLLIRNGPQDISSVSVASVPVGATTAATSATPGQDITITAVPTTGNPVVTVTYTVTASGLSHTDTATMHN